MILQSANCNANTIVILFTGAAIDMSRWKDKVAAIVFAGFCGEALANILTGEINPSGKLSETFPLKIEDIPSFNKYQNSCITRYEEGVDVGYRYYNSYNVDVLYPFGYGLSYSNFEYSKSGTDYDQEGIIIKYGIKNNSVVAGKEISQVYIRPLRYIYRPELELKEFSKDEIEPGASVEVKIKLSLDAFGYYSVGLDKWVTDDGLYEVLVGSSSKDIRIKILLKVENNQIKMI